MNEYACLCTGEMPCRLTQVKDYARHCGLQSGDLLHAVNGRNVERMTHEQVVNLITSSTTRCLRLHLSTDHGDDTRLSHDESTSSSTDAEEHPHRVGNQSQWIVDHWPQLTDESTSSSGTFPSHKSIVSSQRADGEQYTSNHHRPAKVARSRATKLVNAPLRPSQTYQYSGGDNTSRSHSTKSKPKYSFKSCKAKPSHDHPSHRYGSATSLVKHELSNGDMIYYRPMKEDELLLHQHYRNKLKCAQAANFDLTGNALQAKQRTKPMFLSNDNLHHYNQSRIESSRLHRHNTSAGDRRPIDLMDQLLLQSDGQLDNQSRRSPSPPLPQNQPPSSPLPASEAMTNDLGCGHNRMQVHVDIHNSEGRLSCGSNHHHQSACDDQSQVANCALSSIGRPRLLSSYHNYRSPTSMHKTNSTTSGVSSECSSPANSPPSTAIRNPTGKLSHQYGLSTEPLANSDSIEVSTVSTLPGRPLSQMNRLDNGPFTGHTSYD